MGWGGWPPGALQPRGSRRLPSLSSSDALLFLLLLNGMSSGSDVKLLESDTGSVLFNYDHGQ